MIRRLIGYWNEPCFWQTSPHLKLRCRVDGEMLCGESEELNIYWVPRIVIDYDLNIHCMRFFVKPLCHACHMCIKQFDWRIKDSMWSKYLNMTELNCALSYQTSNETKMSRWRTCSWWRHQMETSSALLALCAGKSPVPGEFPTQRVVTRMFFIPPPDEVILDSPCPSVCPSVRPSVRLSVDDMVSGA